MSDQGDLERYRPPAARITEAEAREAVDPVTYKCHRCLDLALIPVPCPGWHVAKIPPHSRLPCKGCSTSWYCSCVAGFRAEVGYWVDRTWPQRGSSTKRRRSQAGMDELEAYLAGKSGAGSKLMREAINAFLEAERKRAAAAAAVETS